MGGSRERGSRRDVRSFVERTVFFSGSEKKRNAPNARKSDKRVDNTADKSVLSAEDPRNDVELEKTDASPVKCADNSQKQRDSIHDHCISPNKLFAV